MQEHLQQNVLYKFLLALLFYIITIHGFFFCLIKSLPLLKATLFFAHKALLKIVIASLFAAWVLFFYLFFFLILERQSLRRSPLWFRRQTGRHFLLGLLAGFLLLTITVLAIQFTHAITKTPLEVSQPIWQVLVLAFGFSIIIAFAEELLMRGYLLNSLLEIIHPFIAVFIVSCLFGLAHLKFSWLYCLSAFMFGAVLGLAYWQTRSLYFCIGAHFAWNFFEIVYYSPKLYMITVNNPFLAGNKALDPARQGAISTAILFVVILLFGLIQRYQRR